MQKYVHEGEALYDVVTMKFARLFNNKPPSCWTMECLLESKNVGSYARITGHCTKDWFNKYLVGTAKEFHLKVSLHFPYDTDLLHENGTGNLLYWKNFFRKKFVALSDCENTRWRILKTHFPGNKSSNVDDTDAPDRKRQKMLEDDGDTAACSEEEEFKV